ncbi:hypothetical protein B0H14DRAFT_2349273, partial [Mycena olivaceomarginata]
AISLVQPLERARSYVERLGAGLAASPTGHGFVNGKHFNMDDHFQEAVRPLFRSSSVILKCLQPYSGKISDETTDKISTYFYDLPTNTLRQNRYIFPAPGDLRLESSVYPSSSAARARHPG